MKTYFFPETVTKYETIFRYGLMFFVGLFAALALILAGGLFIADSNNLENALSNSFVDNSIMVIMLLWGVIVVSLFIFAVIRLFVTLVTGQYKISLGYLIYLFPIGLFMLPIFFALYDTYARL